MFENKEKTEINKLGEFGLIKHLTKDFTIKHTETAYGIGDDAAVIATNPKQQVISTDLFIENIHFDLMYSPLMHIGYKCISASVSDICAMNAIANQVLVSIALSSKYSLEAVEELYRGIKASCDKYNLELIGGDTSSSVTGLMISITVIGYADEKKIVKRSGAKPGDLLVASGDLGGAYMGLQMLEREKQVFLDQKDMQPDLEGKEYIVGRQLRPEARTDIIELLDEIGIIPTAMIDISDGLSTEIHHLSNSSNISIHIHEEKIPISDDTKNVCNEFKINPTVAALNGGEDYELLFTVNQQHYDKLKKDPDFTIIGFVRRLWDK